MSRIPELEAALRRAQAFIRRERDNIVSDCTLHDPETGESRLETLDDPIDVAVVREFDEEIEAIDRALMAGAPCPGTSACEDAGRRTDTKGDVL